MGRPLAAKIVFITALSIPTADPSTPAPTYGTFASSSSPCTVPSSPYGPCSTGNTTSRPTPVTVAGAVGFEASVLDHVGCGNRRRRLLGERPPPVFFDADGNRFVAAAVEVFDDG